MEPEKAPRERAEDLISLLVPDWRPTSQQILWAIRIGIVLSLLVAIGYSYNITLWDWLKLLIVPAVIAAGGLWFNQQQQERQREDVRRQQERGLEIENQRAQDEALQTYLDQIGQLLLDRERPLRQSEEGDEVRTLARARTLTVLTRLEFAGLRKRSVVQFLYEAKLITKDHIALDLREAYLNFANLNGSDFNLTGVNLHGASLTKATMNATNLVEADLSDTRMFGANLSGADMRRAVLMSKNTGSTPLPRISVTGNYYFHSPGPKNADLRGADLSEVDLTDAYVSEEQLLSAASLEGATMPNGQTLKSDDNPDGPTFEEWLKSTGREEDGESTGTS